MSALVGLEERQDCRKEEVQRDCRKGALGHRKLRQEGHRRTQGPVQMEEEK